jgi:NAD(P)-dependent dehydrogenase (short-subunit alcohol dehydrogenase family)
MAQNLLESGWTVVSGHLDRLPPELSAETGRHVPVQVDVGNDYSVAAFGQAVRQLVESVDVVINNAAILGIPTVDNTIRDGLDYQGLLDVINVNAAGPLRVVQALLPLMQEDGRRRICFVSSEAGSITKSWRDNHYGYCMSKSALNMATSILFKDLRRDGFTLRVYHPGYIRSYMLGEKNTDATLEPKEAAALALQYFTGDDSYDEDRLVMGDFEGKEWPW